MASNDTPKTVILRGKDPVLSEAAAATSEAIKPGMLVELTSAGTLRKHSTVGSNLARAAKLFAVEASYVGDSIDDTFADAEQTPYWAPQPGDQVYAWLADGETTAIGSHLQSAGDGGLELVDSDGHAVAFALEAVTASGLTRVKVQVL